MPTEPLPQLNLCLPRVVLGTVLGLFQQGLRPSETWCKINALNPHSVMGSSVGEKLWTVSFTMRHPKHPEESLTPAQALR